MVWRNTSILVLVLYCGQSIAALEVAAGPPGLRNDIQNTEVLSDEQGTGKLYFTGPGYTINLIPQAILLGILAAIAAFFLGLDLFGSNSASTSGYGAPSVGYGAPEPSYGAPVASYGAPAASYGAPSAGYDAPSSGYTASARQFDYAKSNANLDQYDTLSRRKRSSF
ncbi:uncharacterized protein LOC111698750 [Eurytemora carolleeae]|uniref:uncharacterized protein LOC111698750 n=1 Tax=Eurytemora carolleeae TaxID=1294199 RepID=UPI000C7652E2|nr:uncharacterized protein LOC111698750 [Eurytemora carolleeae]|eukprot:XP_023324934.1 uncharacterized protein LOC111698750 [Eurytemora affinis]